MLPILKYRDALVTGILAYPVTLLIGQTGSGKSTQTLKYLFQDRRIELGKRLLVCTQPRRISAISLATRVASELADDSAMNGGRGDKAIGYNVRFESNMNTNTRILYCTDGILLNMILEDPSLEGFKVIMVDEAHYRNVNADIIISLIKQALIQQGKKVDSVRLVISSATLDESVFIRYFKDVSFNYLDSYPVPECDAFSAVGNVGVFHIPGQSYPISIHYELNKPTSYVNQAITKVLDINQKHDGDILVFMPSKEDIDATIEGLKDKVDTNTVILPLCATLPLKQQQKVFIDYNERLHQRGALRVIRSRQFQNTESVVNGVTLDNAFIQRINKIIVATNIAETSLTIPKIKYVIDSGKVKISYYNYGNSSENISNVDICSWTADQRAGRCGRDGPGSCYRLYPKSALYNTTQDEFENEEFKSIQELISMNHIDGIPEMSRVRLTSVFLNLLARGVNVGTFDYVTRPPKENILGAMEELYCLGCTTLDTIDGKRILRVTELGKELSVFPLDVSFSRSILASAELGCLNEVLMIVAILSTNSSVYLTSHSFGKSDTIGRKLYGSRHYEYDRFVNTMSDHLTMYNIMKEFIEHKEATEKSEGYSTFMTPYEWCHECGFDDKVLETAYRIYTQLWDIVKREKIKWANEKEKESNILKSFMIGNCFNICKRTSAGLYRRLTKPSTPCSIHPSSVITKTLREKGEEIAKLEYLMFDELIVSKDNHWLHNISRVEGEWIYSLLGHIYKK